MFNLSRIMKSPEQPEEAKDKFTVSWCHLIMSDVWKLYLKILKVKQSAIEVNFFICISLIYLTGRSLPLESVNEHVNLRCWARSVFIICKRILSLV